MERLGQKKTLLEKPGRLGDVINPALLKKEYDDAGEQGGKQREEIEPYLERISNERVRYSFYQNGETMGEIDKAGGNLWNILLKAGLGQETLANLTFLVRSATSLLLSEEMKNQETIAKNCGFEKEYAPFGQTNRLVLAGEIFVKIGGICVKDLMENPHLSPISLYRFFMETYVVKKYLAHDEVLEQNSDIPYASSYPTIMKQKIDEAAEYGLAFSNLTPETLEKDLKKIFPNQAGREKEILLKAQQTIKIVTKFRQRIYDTILNPGSPYFPALKDLLMSYLKDDRENIIIMSLRNLGLDYHYRMVGCYRRAKELSRQGQESEFYEFLAQSIRQKYIDYLKEDPLGLAILTKDDFVSISDGNCDKNSETIPTLQDLRIMTNSIFQKSEGRQFFISEDGREEVNWDILVKPKTAAFAFPKGTHQKCNFLLCYENDTGETLNIFFKVDAQKGLADWSFLESPDDPEMAEIKNTFLIVAKSILGVTQKKVEAEYRERQKAKSAEKEPIAPTQIGVIAKPKEPYVPREKEGKPKQSRPLTPIQEVLENGISTLIVGKVKTIISLSKDTEDIEDFMTGISPENRSKIIEGLRRFNEDGVGRFKALRMTYNGKTTYELRVGDFRVLAVEKKENGNGTNNVRQLGIFEIGNRKEIFKITKKRIIQ